MLSLWTAGAVAAAAEGLSGESCQTYSRRVSILIPGIQRIENASPGRRRDEFNDDIASLGFDLGGHGLILPSEPSRGYLLLGSLRRRSVRRAEGHIARGEGGEVLPHGEVEP